MPRLALEYGRILSDRALEIYETLSGLSSNVASPTDAIMNVREVKPAPL